MPQAGASVMRQALRGFREEKQMRKSMKWVKVSGNKLEEYKSFLKIFLEISTARFNCLVVDHKNVDYRKYFGGDKYLAYYRFYFYFLSRNIDLNDFYYVYLHRRETPLIRSLEVLKQKVNKHCDIIRSRSLLWPAVIPTYPVKKLEARDHKTTEELQLVDVILGAVGYHWNKWHLRNPNTAKTALAGYLARELGCEDLIIETQAAERKTAKLNVWRFPLK